MKYLILITSFLLLASCTSETLEKNTQVSTVNATQTRSTALYVDVREPSEWQAGHIEWAILVPLADIEAGRLDKIPKDTPVALYCRSGRRSGIAYDILKKAGYTNISNVWGMDQVPWVQIVR
jgi:phage shock protein E